MTVEQFLKENPDELTCQGWLLAEKKYRERTAEEVIRVQEYMVSKGWKPEAMEFRGTIS